MRLCQVPRSTKAIIACDFFVAVTATFRMLYVFVVIEHGTRRLTHINVTAHPSAEWALQQLREAFREDRHRHLIHNRDRIYSTQLDDSIETLGLEVLRSPVASPKANSIYRSRLWRIGHAWTQRAVRATSILRRTVRHLTVLLDPGRL